MIFWEQLKIQNGAAQDNSATISYPTANNVVTFNRPVTVPTLTITEFVTLPSTISFNGAVTLPNGSNFAASTILPNGSGIAEVLTKESDEYKLNVNTATATNASITGTATITKANITGTATITNANINNLTVTNPVKLPGDSTIGGARADVPTPKNSLYIEGHFGDYEDRINITNNSNQTIDVNVDLYTDAEYTNPYINTRDQRQPQGMRTLAKGEKAQILSFWDADGDRAKDAYVRVRWKFPTEINFGPLNPDIPFKGDEVNSGLYRNFGGALIEDWFRFSIIGYNGNELWFIYSCPFDNIESRRASYLNMLGTMATSGYNYVLTNNTWQTIDYAIGQARTSVPGGGLIAFRQTLLQ